MCDKYFINFLMIDDSLKYLLNTYYIVSNTPNAKKYRLSHPKGSDILLESIKCGKHCSERVYTVLKSIKVRSIIFSNR